MCLFAQNGNMAHQYLSLILVKYDLFQLYNK